MKRIFNSRQEAKRVSKQRGEQYFHLGNKNGTDCYFVGTYNDDVKQTRKSMCKV